MVALLSSREVSCALVVVSPRPSTHVLRSTDALMALESAICSTLISRMTLARRRPMRCRFDCHAHDWWVSLGVVYLIWFREFHCYRGGCVGCGPTSSRRPCFPPPPHPPPHPPTPPTCPKWTWRLLGRTEASSVCRSCAADHMSMCYSSRPTDRWMMYGL